MSLENKSPKTLEKRVFDSSNSLKAHYSYLNQGGEELTHSDSSANIYNFCLESHLSSEFSEESKASIEIDGVRFSQEIEKILAKHLKQSSVVENNVTNNYYGMLDGLKNVSLGKISELSYEDSQKENREDSKKSLKDDSKQHSFNDSNAVLTENTAKINVPKNKIQTEKWNIKSSLRTSKFALTNRIFCLKCSTEVYTDVNYQMKRMNIWGSIGFFLEAVKCCGEPRVLSRYQELVHTCKLCGNIVARISTN